MIRSDRIAIAIFVKTPGISKLKTRLAVDISESKAIEFYKLSCQQIKKRLMAVRDSYPVDCFWALAEAEANANHWDDFDLVYQGEGSLDARIHHIYNQLIRREGIEKVVLIGADAPHLNFARLIEASMESEFTIGPAEDGGFYWFCGNKELPFAVWNSVHYSAPETLENLLSALERQGIQPTMTETEFDVDTVSELNRLKNHPETGQPILKFLNNI